jgi:Spy/CpxP family protein refolding chaperone
MKKLVIIMLALVFTISAFAQEAKSKEQRNPADLAAKRSDVLKTKLGLTDDQRAKVYTALLERITKKQEIKAKYANDETAEKKEMKSVNQSFQASMKQILTPEQFAKLKDLQEENKNNKAGK